MPWYRKHGKIETPLSHEEFLKAMQKGKFVKPKHKAFVALLYYTGVRRGEALRAKKEQFRLEGNQIIFDVGKRLKRGIQTPALNIPLSAPYADEIWKAVEKTKKGERVFLFTDVTAYNIVVRAFGSYPHHLRLSRITNFFKEGFSIAEVSRWTGLTLKALDYYVGLVDVKKMGESLAKAGRKNE